MLFEEGGGYIIEGGPIWYYGSCFGSEIRTDFGFQP